jgi:hypothetical protein
MDQLNNFPYRDPVRLPSIRLAFIFEWAVIVMTLYRLFGIFEEE